MHTSKRCISVLVILECSSSRTIGGASIYVYPVWIEKMSIFAATWMHLFSLFRWCCFRFLAISCLKPRGRTNGTEVAFNNWVESRNKKTKKPKKLTSCSISSTWSVLSFNKQLHFVWWKKCVFYDNRLKWNCTIFDGRMFVQIIWSHVVEKKKKNPNMIHCPVHNFELDIFEHNEKHLLKSKYRMHIIFCVEKKIRRFLWKELFPH